METPSKEHIQLAEESLLPPPIPQGPRGSRGSYDREYYLKNKEKMLQRSKEYYNKIKNTPDSYYQQNKEYYKERSRQYYHNNKEKVKQYYMDNREKIKEYYQQNKERLKLKREEENRKNTI